MNRNFLYTILVLLPIIWLSCSSQRKSANFYHEHKEVLTEIRSLYDSLYRIQPFSIGFTDKSYRYYEMQVRTDTLRYVYDTEKSESKLFTTIKQFNYDTALLRQLADKMESAKCLWLDKASFYQDGKKEAVTFLSFKSALIEAPFEENKYYILVFLNHQLQNPDSASRIKEGKMRKIDDLVYFTIGNRYR